MADKSKRITRSAIEVQLMETMHFSMKLSVAQAEIHKSKEEIHRLKEEIFRLEQLLATAQQNIALHEYCDELDWVETNNQKLEENQ